MSYLLLLLSLCGITHSEREDREKKRGRYSENQSKPLPREKWRVRRRDEENLGDSLFLNWEEISNGHIQGG